MPATAGRVRIPALQTHGIRQSAIGYDPYAPSANSSDPNPAAASSAASQKPSSSSTADHAYSSFQGLLALARITGTSFADDTRGACRNFLSVKDDSDDIDASTPASADEALRKIKEALRKNKESLRKIKEEFDFKDVDSESDSSNSDKDPEIERILAERSSKKSKRKVPVQTESLSRASPNWNPLHEALQEVAKESKGLSDETIASFRMSKFKSGFSSRSKKPSDNCALCQSAIRKGEYLITLPCKHYFHKECITRWLKMNKVCCMCKYEMEEN